MDREKIPAIGVQYLLTIMLPQLGQRANLRTQRELRTLMVAIDLLARLNPARAADVLCQRVKALERASMDGGWASAQFLELIPSETARQRRASDLNKETLLEQKLHRRDQGSHWKRRSKRIERSRKGSKEPGKTDTKDK